MHALMQMQHRKHSTLLDFAQSMRALSLVRVEVNYTLGVDYVATRNMRSYVYIFIQYVLYNVCVSN